MENIIFFNSSLYRYFYTGLGCLEKYSHTALDFRFKLFSYNSANTPCSYMIIEGCIVDKSIGYVLPTLLLYMARVPPARPL